jgi:uncharacterized RDD family membrane protein YckC
MTKPGFCRRIAALLIDYVLILGWMAVVFGVSMAILATTGSLPNWLAAGTAVAELLGFAVLVLPVGIYLWATESSSRQATVGKRALGMRVVTMDGAKPSRRRILVRTAVKLLPWEWAHFWVWQLMAIVLTGGIEFPAWLVVGLVSSQVLPVAYVLCVAIQKDRRGPHDLVAGTRVVRSYSELGTS